MDLAYEVRIAGDSLRWCLTDPCGWPLKRVLPGGPGVS